MCIRDRENLVSPRIIHLCKGISGQGAGYDLSDRNDYGQLNRIQIIGEEIYPCPHLLVVGPAENLRNPFDRIFKNFPVIFKRG